MLARRGREIAAMLLPSLKQLSTTIWSGEAITAYVAHEQQVHKTTLFLGGSVICLMVRHQRRYVISSDPIKYVYRTCALMQWFRLSLGQTREL